MLILHWSIGRDLGVREVRVFDPSWGAVTFVFIVKVIGTMFPKIWLAIAVGFK